MCKCVCVCVCESGGRNGRFKLTLNGRRHCKIKKESPIIQINGGEKWRRPLSVGRHDAAGKDGIEFDDLIELNSADWIRVRGGEREREKSVAMKISVGRGRASGGRT